MNTSLFLAGVIGLAACLPASAMPAERSGTTLHWADSVVLAQYAPTPHHRHYYRYGGQGGPYGGFRVNRYGNGNYTAGPNGFAGYPAGSGAAQIYRQQQEWKCQSLPESC